MSEEAEEVLTAMGAYPFMMEPPVAMDLPTLEDSIKMELPEIQLPQETHMLLDRLRGECSSCAVSMH